MRRWVKILFLLFLLAGGAIICAIRWQAWFGMPAEPHWNGDTIGHLYIKLLKSKLETQDVAGFKKWLQSNPVTVVYQLATPTTEDIQISPTDNPLTSYTPSTTLTTNNNIKGNISADMPTNLSGVITQQASLIAQLEDNLLQTQALLIDNVIDNT